MSYFNCSPPNPDYNNTLHTIYSSPRFSFQRHKVKQKDSQTVWTGFCILIEEGEGLLRSGRSEGPGWQQAGGFLTGRRLPRFGQSDSQLFYHQVCSALGSSGVCIRAREASWAQERIRCGGTLEGEAHRSSNFFTLWWQPRHKAPHARPGFLASKIFQKPLCSQFRRVTIQTKAMNCFQYISTWS